jgi:hypothetical protein
MRKIAELEARFVAEVRVQVGGSDEPAVSAAQ